MLSHLSGHTLLRQLRALSVLNAGLVLMGFSTALMLGANIGVNPWPVLHEGLNLRTALTFGQATQLLGLALLAPSWLAFREKVGVGTVLNMLLVGPWVDVFRGQAWLPVQETLLWGLPQFLLGVAVFGFATALYISANLGAGPRDGFVLGLAKKSGWSVQHVRGGLELTALAVGFLLGGPVGVGTLLFTLLIGPLMQGSLRLLRYTPTPKAHAAKQP